MTKISGTLGIAAFVVFGVALIVVSQLNSGFSFADDFISKLGANGQPFAPWWNFIGFMVVGTLLFVFGLTYGRLVKDTLVTILLSLFGLGFALTSFPVDVSPENSVLSLSHRVHIVAICLALACWLFALARLGYNTFLEKKVRTRANVAAVLLVLPMFGFVLNLWSMPTTHKLVFAVVFGWTLVTSIDLLKQPKSNPIGRTENT